MPKISEELLNECACLVYSKWIREHDLLIQVKQETDDGTKDWKQFHDIRLIFHTSSERKARAFLDEITTLHTIGRIV